MKKILGMLAKDGKTTTENVYLVKEDGDWKVDVMKK